MLSSAESIMLTLKTQTAALHHATESSDFEQSLVGGRLPRQVYVEMLGQFLLVHAELESNLRQTMGINPAVRSVVKEEQFGEPNLQSDLADLGFDAADVRPLPATSALVEEIARCGGDHPVALLGFHYVFEGSKNGGRYIARAIRAAYGLAQGGTRYLDPYGESQRDRWHEFKSAMDACTFSELERAAIVDCACRAFEGIGRIHAELFESCVTGTV